MDKGQLKLQLSYQRNELKSAASLYGCLIQNSLMSSTVQRIEEMRLHQDGINEQAAHQDFKSQAEKCLSCANVLTCTRKC
jgi:hypothetical protein